MKAIATITDDNSETVTISYDDIAHHLFTESFSEPTTEVGPQFETEDAAAQYIRYSWGRGWNLTWLS